MRLDCRHSGLPLFRVGVVMSEDLDNAFDMKCPKCGDSGQIDVAATVWVRLSCDGTDADAAENGDHEWGDDADAVCHSCGHSGKVRDFEVDNQPDADRNEARAKRAADALYGYVIAKGEVYEESSSEIVDLITDLLHLAIRLDQGDDPVGSALRLAQMHFEAEHSDEGGQP